MDSELSAKWYVVHTYSGYENKVAQNIEKVVENRRLQDTIQQVRVPVEIVEQTQTETGKKPNLSFSQAMFWSRWL